MANQQKDGTADLRIRGNAIIWRNSKLYIDMQKLVSTKPYDILYVVKELRLHGTDIELCKEEKLKYNQLLKYRKAFSYNSGIRGIIDYYEKEPTGFEKFCAQLFNSMGYVPKLTPKSNDGGFDILLSKENEASPKI